MIGMVSGCPCCAPWSPLKNLLLLRTGLLPALRRCESSTNCLDLPGRGGIQAYDPQVVCPAFVEADVEPSVKNRRHRCFLDQEVGPEDSWRKALSHFLEEY